MNRKSAKLSTATGAFCCVLAAVLFTVNLYNGRNYPQIIFFLLFVIGIILTVFSLAYYTEK